MFKAIKWAYFLGRKLAIKELRADFRHFENGIILDDNDIGVRHYETKAQKEAYIDGFNRGKQQGFIVIQDGFDSAMNEMLSSKDWTF